MTTASNTRCFSMVVAERVIEDKTTSNMSFVNTIDSAQVLAFASGLLMDVETVSFWHFDQAHQDKDIVLRLVVSDQASDEQYDSGELKLKAPKYNPQIHVDKTAWARIRVKGLTLPPRPGSYELKIDWKLKSSSDWIGTDARWFMKFTEASASVGFSGENATSKKVTGSKSR